MNVDFFKLPVFLLLLSALTVAAQSTEPVLTTIATDLLNPRGVAVLPDGRLIVAEAGTGYVGDDADNTGRLSVFEDTNADGDYDDPGERTAILDDLSGYNILYQFQPGRDEIVGIGDVLALDDGRVLFTLDDQFEKISIMALSPELEPTGDFYVSGNGTINAIAVDEETGTIYAALSTLNAIARISPEGDGDILTTFDLLAHDQQAVPSGLTLDPVTGDLLVTLFSGNLWDYYGEVLSFMPGDAKVIRLDPATGAITDEITGLTTAVDVAVDETGNRYVVQMTTEWPAPTMDTNFDLFAPDAAPDAGGYARFTGRVTMHPAGTDETIILADDLDQPTNITYHDGRLYVSVGQGTPGRRIWADGEMRQITGQLLMLTLNP